LVVDNSGTLDIRDCSNFNVLLTVGSTTTPISSNQLALVQQTQTGGPPICVVRFGNITIAQDVTLTVFNNSSSGNVLSLHAVGDVQVDGTIAFKNSAKGVSRGASTVANKKITNNKTIGAGGGGGGGAFGGGSGGNYVTASGSTVQIVVSGGEGGAAITNIKDRLIGGSSGGDVTYSSTLLGIGGVGGGAIQLVSQSRVVISATGRIDLNGAAGLGADLGTIQNPVVDLPAGGGGSGGTLVIEAPVVNLSAGAIIAANGGGGAGGCYTCNPFFCAHVNGEAGQLSATRAKGGDCPNSYPGDGGYAVNGVLSPSMHGDNTDVGGTQVSGGGGGGSDGFVILRGRSAANVTISGTAIVSPLPTIEAVKAN